MTEKQRALWDRIQDVRELSITNQSMGAFTYDLFEKLMKARRYAQRYHALCVQACNGDGAFSWMHEHLELSPEEYDVKYSAPFEQIEKRLEKLFEFSGKGIDPLIKLEFQRDPRGWEIKIICRAFAGRSISQWIYGQL